MVNVRLSGKYPTLVTPTGKNENVCSPFETQRIRHMVDTTDTTSSVPKMQHIERTKCFRLLLFDMPGIKLSEEKAKLYEIV